MAALFIFPSWKNKFYYRSFLVSLTSAGDLFLLDKHILWADKTKMDFSSLILSHDDWFLWVNKPAGLVVHETLDKSRPNLFNLARSYLKADYLTLPHRLDKDTSGVILFCLNEAANGRIQKLFLERKVRKLYWGLCHGQLPHLQGRWQHYLKSKSEHGMEKMVIVQSGGKKAVTDFRVLGQGPQHQLVEFEIHTGRMHQIRVQSAQAKVPLLGDKLYGDDQADLKFPTLRRHCLHAISLEFMHPFKHSQVKVQAPLPDDMLKLSPQK